MGSAHADPDVASEDVAARLPARLRAFTRRDRAAENAPEAGGDGVPEANRTGTPPAAVAIRRRRAVARMARVARRRDDRGGRLPRS